MMYILRMTQERKSNNNDNLRSKSTRFDVYTAVRGPFGTTRNLHPFPEIDIRERFPAEWEASSPAGLCTGNNSALLSFRVPQHDFWGGSGDLELLSADTSSLSGDVDIFEVTNREET